MLARCVSTELHRPLFCVFGMVVKPVKPVQHNCKAAVEAQSCGEAGLGV